MPVIRSSFSEADTRDLVFRVLAQFADGLRERPTLYTIYDEIDLLPGEFAPAWVRRIYFDAVTRRVVETAVEFLRRIGAPPPNPYTADDQETLMAAERGRRAIADPSDERADAVGRAQSRAAREY
jgi:hypothetical protein